MAYYEQQSIDLVLSSSSPDLAQMRSALNTYFQRPGSRISRNRTSIKTPVSPGFHDAFSSYSRCTFTTSRKSKQGSSPLIHTTRHADGVLDSSSKFSSSYTSFDDYFAGSVLYTPTEPGDSPTWPSHLTPSSLPSPSSPSTVSTPVTPRTPNSPLLPGFPDVDLTIYKDIPFSPVTPTFTDCPFQYYHENVPCSKSRAALRLPVEMLYTLPTSPGQVVQVSHDLWAVEALASDTREPEKMEQMSCFDFDSDLDSDSDYDVGSPEHDSCVVDGNEWQADRDSDTSCQDEDKHGWIYGASLKSTTEQLQSKISGASAYATSRSAFCDLSSETKTAGRRKSRLRTIGIQSTKTATRPSSTGTTTSAPILPASPTSSQFPPSLQTPLSSLASSLTSKLSSPTSIMSSTTIHETSSPPSYQYQQEDRSSRFEDMSTTSQILELEWIYQALKSELK